MKEEFEFPMVTASKASLARRKLVCGVGINDAEYKTHYRDNKGKTYSCPYYKRWRSMIERGYCPKVKENQPTYKDVTVCKGCHTFSTFKLWMEKQDWRGKQLDKDIIIPDNKVYSPETCVFVSGSVNSLLLHCGQIIRKNKLGVCLDRGKFKAGCGDGSGKIKNIGHFPTEQLAYEAYVTYKHARILKVADEQEDIRVKKGLLLHADILLKTLDEE